MSEQKAGVIDKLLHLSVTVFPLFLIAMVAVGIGFAYYVERPDFAIRGLLVAVPTIMAAIFLPRMYHSNTENDEQSLKVVSLSQSNAILAYSAFFIISIALLIFEYIRTWHYFAVIAIISTIILYQILSKSSNTNVILIEIFALTLNLIYSVTLKYAFYFGSTDIAGHLFMVEVINASGRIIPADLDLLYYYFPLFHILNAQLFQFSGINLQTTFFVVSGIIFSTTVFVVYYIFKKATDNNTLSLLSALMYALSTVVIYYGPYMVTRTMAYIGFLFILYLLYKRGSKYSTVYMGLAIFMGIFTILVHQVSAAQIAGMMFILLISERLLSEKHYIPISYFLFFLMGFIGYWFLVAKPFLDSVLGSRTDPAIYEHALLKDSVQAENAWIYILNHLDTTVFLFFALIGIGYLLWDRIKIHKGTYPQYYSVIALFSFFTIILFIPTPLQTLWQTMTLFRFDRFMLLISPSMAFVMAAGIYLLLIYIFRNNNKTSKLFIISIIIAAFAFTSTYYGGPEEKSNIGDFSREYFNLGEINGINFIKSHVNNGGRLYSDYYVTRDIIERNFTESKKLNLPYYTNIGIDKVTDIPTYRGYMLIRQQAFEGTGIYLGENNKLFSSTNSTNKVVLSDSLINLNKIYSNYGLDVYSSFS